MAWEERQNGHQYFYLSRRLPDGRIHKEYFGKGLRAEVEAMRLEQRDRQRQEDTQRNVVLDELNSMAEEYAYRLP